MKSAPRSSLKHGLLLLLGALFCAPHVDAADEQPIQIGTRHTIVSKIMGEERPYLVHTPGEYELTDEAYPLVILLDGDGHFQHAVASAEYLSEEVAYPDLLSWGSVTRFAREI